MVICMYLYGLMYVFIYIFMYIYLRIQKSFKHFSSTTLKINLTHQIAVYCIDSIPSTYSVNILPTCDQNEIFWFTNIKIILIWWIIWVHELYLSTYSFTVAVFTNTTYYTYKYLQIVCTVGTTLSSEFLLRWNYINFTKFV